MMGQKKRTTNHFLPKTFLTFHFPTFPSLYPPRKAWQSSWQVEPSAPALVGLMGM